MSFRAENCAYEKWLKTQCDVVEDDLIYKHKRMQKNAFTFLRATFFRWAQRIKDECPDLAEAPAVLSVGDVHIENFGTWRDREGRLVWGINDFDEAADIPYPFDLVRLATSAILVPHRNFGMGKIAKAILKGYQKGIAKPRPTLLDQQDTWMRPLVTCSDKERLDFWTEVAAYPDAAPSRKAVRVLKKSLPANSTIIRFAARTRIGGGSLGRPRFLAIAAWDGGRIVREAKAFVPSAWPWANEGIAAPSRFLDLANGMYRSPDPHLDVREGFILRRLAADSRKVELGGGRPFSPELLTAMAFDIGSIHAADQRCTAVRSDLSKRSAEWLYKGANRAAGMVKGDFREWANKQPRGDGR